MGGFQKMARKSKRIMCLLFSLFMIVLNVRVARAEAVPDILYGSATVADCVMSYYAMAGAGIANTTWINTLYDSLGSSFGTVYDFAENGMLTINADGTWQATTALTEAIENSSAYTSLGLDTAFNISAEEAAAGGGFAAASGGSILSGALGGLGSTGVLPILGGVTAAYWGGIALGTLAAHLLGLYEEPIYYGVDMLTSEDYLNLIPSGGRGFSTRDWGKNGGITAYVTDPGIIGLCYFARHSDSVNEGDIYTRYFYNPTDSNLKWYIYNPSNHSLTSYNIASHKSSSNGASYMGYTDGFKVMDKGYSDTELQNMYNNGNLSNKPTYSPDIMGENGNLSGENQNGNIDVPDLKPQIDPGVQSGVPLSLSDWLNFANSVNSNNSQTNPLPDNQALFDNLLTAIKKALPNPDPDPNPNPDPDPNPDPYTPPVTNPVPDPDYDPVPDNPEQPDYESEKEKMTETVPDSVPTGAPWTTDGLLEKFPFCIPKDMIDMVKHFGSGARQAPYISWTFNPPNTPVDYTFNLDLSDYEDIATLVRLLELGLFIVGLAFATRYLIGAS